MFTSRVPTPMEVAVASLLRRVGTGRGTGSMPGCVQTCPRGLCPHFLCPGVFTLFLMVKAGQESPQKASGWARGPGEWVTQQVAIGACHTGQLSGRLTEKNNEGSGLPQKQGGREDSLCSLMSLIHRWGIRGTETRRLAQGPPARMGQVRTSKSPPLACLQ